MDALNHLIDRIEELVKLENTRIEEQIRQTNVRISELESAKTSNDEELKLIETRIDELNLTKMRLQQKWKSKRTQMLERLTRIFEDGGCNPPDRIMELQFRNEISKLVKTGDEFAVEVALVNPTTNKIVETGQESSAKFEIVVFNGGVEDDLTGEAFKVLPEMEGKEPLVRENPQVKLQRGKAPLNKISLKLQRGKASVDKISFKHNRSNTKQQQIRLGARITNQIFDGVRVKEAMTETFTVKDFRYKYNEKHGNPLLSDKVSRLVNIGRGGKIVKYLKDNKIETVEDFLIQLLRNPERLKRIAKLAGSKWEKTVDNARRASPRDRRMYCYINSERKMGVAYNVIGQVLGIYLNDQYSPTTVLSEKHKDVAQELLSSACKHWDGVKTFDDENALKSYLNGLRIPDSINPEYRGEMVGESSSRSHFSAQSNISSAINSTMEIGDDDLLSCYNIDNLEIDVNDDPLQYISHHSMFDDLETLMSDFEDFHKYFEEQGAATVFAYGESGGVEISKRLKRWKKLFSVFRVFSIRKKLSVGSVHHIQKKQKTR